MAGCGAATPPLRRQFDRAGGTADLLGGGLCGLGHLEMRRTAAGGAGGGEERAVGRAGLGSVRSLESAALPPSRGRSHGAPGRRAAPRGAGESLPAEAARSHLGGGCCGSGG